MMPAQKPHLKTTETLGNKPSGNGLNKIIIVAIALLLIALLGIAAIILVLPPLQNTAAGGAYVPNGVAIIPLKGEISNGDSGDGASANSVVEMIEQAENDPAVGAVFLDIDSPGGEVVASKLIVYKVRESKKPVYSYINSVGASGAYYIASASKYIMADEDSITGGIGVISIGFNLEGLLEKLGIKASVLKVGKYKDIGSPFKGMTEDENRIVQEILEQAYGNFRANVLEFRKGKIAAAQLDSVADGRILTGTQALKANLVDELLTREKAIGRAAELSGIKSPNKIQYGEKEFSLSDFFFSSGKSFGSGIVSSLGAESAAPEIK